MDGDIIKAVLDAPLSTLVLIFGFLTLSVGYGLRVRVVFDVERINKTYAKVAGVILLVIGFSLRVYSAESGAFSATIFSDPFFAYYLVIVPLVVGLYWATLKFTNGPTQLRATGLSFKFVGAFVTIVVLWRLVDVIFYVKKPGPDTLPTGLYGGSNFLPYFGLIGLGIAVSLWAIYAYTKKQENTENRISIFSNFIVSCIYLALCRLVWEIADYCAKTLTPPL